MRKRDLYEKDAIAIEQRAVERPWVAIKGTLAHTPIKNNKLYRGYNPSSNYLSYVYSSIIKEIGPLMDQMTSLFRWNHTKR